MWPAVLIALTAHATKEEREKCMAAGCDDYRSKPISPTELLCVLGKWCRPKDETAELPS